MYREGPGPKLGPPSPWARRLLVSVASLRWSRAPLAAHAVTSGLRVVATCDVRRAPFVSPLPLRPPASQPGHECPGRGSGCPIPHPPAQLSWT